MDRSCDGEACDRRSTARRGFWGREVAAERHRSTRRTSLFKSRWDRKSPSSRLVETEYRRMTGFQPRGFKQGVSTDPLPSGRFLPLTPFHDLVGRPIGRCGSTDGDGSQLAAAPVDVLVPVGGVTYNVACKLASDRGSHDVDQGRCVAKR